LVALAVLTACAVEPTPVLKPVSSPALQSIETLPILDGQTLEPSEDVCSLAAQLPPDDLCSLICDPDALEDAIVDAGAEAGRCYLLVCVLSEDVAAQVGVCLL
jgi:hypothetical protein